MTTLPHTSAMPGATAPRQRSDAFPANWRRRLGFTALFLYALYALSTLEITRDRFIRGLAQGAGFLARMWPPNTEATKLELLQQGMLESIQIAILATAAGVAIAIPLGLLAARNLMPTPVSWAARGLIALCRSFHPVIVTILFVKAVGFGALAGILGLVVSSLGFISKLLAEAIEEMNLKQVEAVRATGATFAGVLVMSIVPQVTARFVGFVAYQLDSNLRNSTMVGIVGGGGIGATLFTAYQRFDYDFVMTILLVIIAIVMVSELVSARIRRIFQ
jgi:phosphonate ABC transporter permease subunit PhnE